MMITLFSISTVRAQVVINEINTFTDEVELLNLGSEEVDVSSYIFCTFPAYTNLNTATIVSGDLSLSPGEFVVLSGHSLGDDDGELGLYTASPFDDSNNIIDYLEWGSSGHPRASIAMAAGIWVMSDFVDAPPVGESMMYDGDGNGSANWFFGPPTLGAANEEGGECEADGGILSTSALDNVFTICAGDGVEDPIDVTLEGNMGSNSQWVITDPDGVILGLPESGPFDLEDAGGGQCLIWNLSYEDGIVGLAVDADADDLEGCFDLSNPVTVNRVEITGGTVATSDGETAVTVEVGDGIDDIISFESVDDVGQNYAYIITDDQDNILGFPPGDSNNFEDANGGICRVYGIAYIGELETENAIDLDDVEATDCYDISDNYIEVTRLEISSVEAQDVTNIKVYPNPATSFVRFDLPFEGATDYVIYSIDGREVKKGQLNQSDANLSIQGLDKGIYQIHLHSINNERLVARLVKE